MSASRPYHLLLGWSMIAVGFYGGVASANGFNVVFLFALFIVFLGGFFVGQSE